jgi:hypothetical protein
MELTTHVTPPNLPAVPAQKGTIYVWTRKIKPTLFDPDVNGHLKTQFFDHWPG